LQVDFILSNYGTHQDTLFVYYGYLLEIRSIINTALLVCHCPLLL